MSDTKSWTVTMSRTVRSVYVTEPCTEEQAREDPWAHIRDEGREIECSDSDVEKVEPND